MNSTGLKKKKRETQQVLRARISLSCKKLAFRLTSNNLEILRSG